jgi:CheY-like chemotaxis protein
MEGHLNILVVDPNPYERTSLLRALAVAGHRARAAVGVSEALSAMAGTNKPDLILADFNAGSVTDLALLNDVPAGEAGNARIPLVLMTTAGVEAALSAIAKAGLAVPVVDKPVSLQEIVG